VRAIRFRYALLVASLLLALAGCGGGGGSTSTTTTAVSSAPAQTPSATATAQQPAPTTTAPAPTQTTPARKKKKKSPENQPGGAGDETPIATQAQFTAKGGKVSPSRVRVPPFIAVNIVLRAVDEKPYTLLVNNKEVAVGEGRTEASLKLDGLRPGGKYIVRPQFGVKPQKIVIIANAEPGP
jgi:hypothetical protein